MNLSANDSNKLSSKPTRFTARNGAFALADQFLVSGTRFGVSMLIAQACGEVALGVYALVLSLVLMCLMVQQTLVTTPYSNFRNRLEPARELDYFCDVSFLAMASIGIATLMIVTFAAALGLAASILTPETAKQYVLGELALGSAAAALATPFMLSSEFFRRTWLIRSEAIRALAYDAGVSLTVIVTAIIMFRLDRLNAPVAFAILAGTHLAANGLVIRKFLPQRPFDRVRLQNSIAQHWHFGRWIFSSEAVSVGRAQLLKWIIGAILGIGATGIYSACDSLMRAVNPFFLGVASVAEPSLAAGYAKAGTQEVRRIALKVLMIMVLGTLPICLIVALTSESLLYHLFGPSFAQYSAVVVLLSGASFVFSMSYPFANALQAIDRPIINFRIRLATMLIVLLGAATIAPHWGLRGVATMHLIGTVVSLSMRLYFFRRHFLAPESHAPSNPARQAL